MSNSDNPELELLTHNPENRPINPFSIKCALLSDKGPLSARYNIDNNIIDKDNTMNIFPCQKEQVKKESLILEIESKLYKLQRERDKLNDELFKLPEFPKKKIEINQRRELELKIEKYNKEINEQKLKLRELNKIK